MRKVAKEYISKKGGFTLIELMVSVAIFSIVMVIALGALLAISTADRRAEALKSVMDNLNFAVENMSRTIRTGLYYTCSPSLPVPLTGGVPTPSDCPGGGTSIAVYSAEGKVVVYRVNAACNGTNACLDRSTDGGNTFAPITASEVVVDSGRFYIKGAPLGDGFQPKVTITLNGHVQVSSAQNTSFTPYTIQTSLTQRLYDQ